MTQENRFRYRSSQYRLSSSQIKELQLQNTSRSFIAIILVWFQISGILLIAQYVLPPEYFGWAYVPIIFLVASRQGALLQLVHEGAHTLLAKSKRVNDLLGKWLCALPVGVSYEGYKAGHLRHHAGVGTEIDPPSDSEKYRVTDFRRPKLYLLLLKDLFGITGLFVFLTYGNNSKDPKLASDKQKIPVIGFIQLCLVQFSIVLIFFGSRSLFGAEPILFHHNLLLDNLTTYILLWLIPAASPHMFLMRIRGIAEHGLMRQLGVDEGFHYSTGTNEGMFYTRSFLTPMKQYRYKTIYWLERLLIGSFHVNYHHEHHLYPRTPWYNLPKLHSLIARQVEGFNPDVYARGYFSAAMRNVLPTQ